MPDQSEQNQEENKETDEHQEEGENEETEKALRHVLAQCRKEKTEYLLGWQRCKADAVNIKQQEEIKRRDIIQFAAEDLIQALIPVLETFNYALRGKDAKDPYVQGFGHIQNQFITILKSCGLTVIEDIGVVFDTSRHESVGMTPAAKKEEDNTVMEVVENGYALYEKVIKPAKVKIGEYKNHGSDLRSKI